MSNLPAILWFIALLIGIILGWGLVGVLMFWVANWARARGQRRHGEESDDDLLDVLDTGD